MLNLTSCMMHTIIRYNMTLIKDMTKITIFSC
jgi:hypothetical protein